MNYTMRVSWRKSPIAILVATTLSGCSTVSPEENAQQYGVEQISMNGSGQYVLCNPCRMPTPKEPETTNVKTALRYGDSIGSSIQTAMSRLSTIATLATPAIHSYKSVAAPLLTTSQAVMPTDDASPNTPASVATSGGSTKQPDTNIKPPLQEVDDVYKMAMTPQDTVIVDTKKQTPVTSDTEPTSAEHTTAAQTPVVQNDQQAETAPVPVTGASETKKEDEADYDRVGGIKAANIGKSNTDKIASIDTGPTSEDGPVADQISKFTVNFASNSADPEEAAMGKILEKLRNSPPETRIVIIGYSDSVGGLSVNDHIAQSRAGNARNWLSRNGVSPDKVVADPSASRGLCCFVADNDNEAGRAANRRAEITFVVPSNIATNNQAKCSTSVAAKGAQS